MFERFKSYLLRLAYVLQASLLLLLAVPIAARADSNVPLNPAQFGITAASFGSQDCQGFGDSGAPYPDRDLWHFVLPSPSTSGEFISVTLGFDTNLDNTADNFVTIPTEGGSIFSAAPGTVSHAVVDTPAGWVLTQGVAVITGFSEIGYFNLSHTCAASGVVTPTPPTLDVLTYDYQSNTISGSGSCTNPVIYGEMYDSGGNIYMSGNLNTNTNVYCINGHYDFSFDFTYWTVSPNFDLNNPNEVRVYSITGNNPQPGEPYASGYFTRTAPYQTPTGSNVSVNLGDGVSVTFDNVTAGGTTTVSASSHPNVAPKAIKYGTPGHYLSFSTTATISGNVTVCVNYDPATITGNESNLKMSQFDTGWADITYSLDTNSNMLCGVVTGL